MKKVMILRKTQIDIKDVAHDTPIFAKIDGKLEGMIVKVNGEGWILKTGGTGGATGYHETRSEVIDSCLALNYKSYEFFIED